MENKRIQTSESLTLAIVLALSGGFMDAYSYLCHGKVFANGQTGNMVLLGINIFEGNWLRALNYAMPITCFVIGLLIAETIRYKANKSRTKLHWRQGVLLAEIAFLAIVSQIPVDLIANSLTSLACGIQVEAFRKLHGNNFATTMCIGNLRSGTEKLFAYTHTKNKDHLKAGLLYFCVIFFFIIGAILGNFIIKFLNTNAILVCCALLFIAFLMMFVEERSPKYFSRHYIL